jgi:phage-related protein
MISTVNWQVVVLNETVQKELDALPEDNWARLIRLTRLIVQQDLENVREPYVKHLTGKIWEMRLKGKDGIARALYITATGGRVVILRAFVKKTQKTPDSEIDIALRRAKEVV